jgi:hypothetical protein
MLRRAPLVAACSLASLLGCQRPPDTERFRPAPLPDAGAVAELTPLFVTAPRPACEFSGPLAITSQGEPEILIATADGVFTALIPRPARSSGRSR